MEKRKERSVVNRHDNSSWHEELPDTQHQLPFPARPSDTPSSDFDHFPFLPVPENPSQRESHDSEQTNRQGPARRLQRLLGQVLLTLVLVVLAFVGGWFAHQYFGQGQTFDAGNQSRAYAQLIQQAWTDIDQHYVDRNAVDYKKMSYAAINAMVNSLGDSGHSHFADPQVAQFENRSINGKFTGIGLSFQREPTTQQWTVSQLVPHGPADKAGLKLYDVITSINGVGLTANMDENAAFGLVQGAVDTPVTFVIQRPGESQPRTFTVTIAEIDVPNVLMYYIPESHIAHIQVVAFSQGVASDVRDDINKAKAMGATKFIIDLRGNPGGSLDEAVKMSSLFLPSGNVLLEQDSSGQRTSIPVNGNPLDTTSPIVILVNRYTASAAEIITGALKENHRAIVIGTKTFGTGTILLPYPLADGSALYLGAQEWLTPDGHFVRRVAGDPNSGGIEPNIQVDPNQLRTLTPNEELQLHMSQQRILNSGDTQLVTAIQYLNQQK
jgi:carboxyl-terminal processing protease